MRLLACRSITVGVGVAFLLSLAACGSNQASTGETGSALVGDADTPVGCATDPRAQAYAPNLVKQGEAGVFTFVLVSSTPGPPGLDQNTWVIAVEDASGNMVPGATLTSVVPWMPDHGHGTSTPTITPNSDGTITVSSIYLFMTGLWQTTIVAEAGGQMDSAMFSFCVGE